MRKFNIDLSKVVVSTAMTVTLVSCGETASVSTGGGSSEVLSSASVGISVPSNVNTIPTDTVAPLIAAVKAAPISGVQYLATSDFDKMGDLQLKVSEPSLDKFSVIESILGAFAQTGYSDPRAINKGAYKAMIKWQNEDGSTTIENWIIDSRMIVVNGADVNRVRFWIDSDVDPVRGILDISEAPSANNKYGKWRIDVEFVDPVTKVQVGTFVAEAKVNSNGTVQVGVNQAGEHPLKGVLFLTNTTGKGIVSFPDYESCTAWPCTPPVVVSKYGYDTNHALIQKGANAPVCKDRTNYADIYSDYAVFNADGMDVRKEKTYSFPLKTASGPDQWLYYSGWNGRQQLWGEKRDNNGVVEDPLLAGTELQHGEYGNNSRYNISSRVMGALVKKTKSNVTEASIEGQVLEGQTGQGNWFVMKHDSGSWKKCNQIDWAQNDCTTLTGTVVDVDANGDLNAVGMRAQITVFGDRTWQNVAYNTIDTSKIYQVNTSYPLYLKYIAGGWKKLTPDYSSNPYEPTFPGDQAYVWPDGTFYFWSKSGANFMITAAGGVPSIVRESQTVVKPGEAIAGDFCQIDWQGTCMGPMYAWDHVAAQLELGGALVTNQIWDLKNTTDNTRYAWDYNTWSELTYLTYGANPPAGKNSGDLVILDPAINFDKVVGKKLDGSNVDVYGLGYDGHLMGYTDVWQMLYKSRQDDPEAGLSPEQKAKIVNFPSTTTLTTGSGAVTYKIKPLRGFRLLDTVPAGCTATIDGSLTLTSAPTFALPATIGAWPTNVTLKVVEGVYIEDKVE